MISKADMGRDLPVRTEMSEHRTLIKQKKSTIAHFLAEAAKAQSELEQAEYELALLDEYRRTHNG